MNHRKRSQLQHKVEQSTLLKIVLAKKRNKHATHPQTNEADLTNKLVAEAIELINMPDAEEITTRKTRRTAVEYTKAVY
jgi:hypothetical protein